MREIKFRGKSVADGDWVYGFLVPMLKGFGEWAITGDHFLHREDDEYGDLLAAEEYCQVLSDTIGQYTGRADVADQPVFEGDIINVPGTEGAVGVVRFGNHPPHISCLEGTGTGFYIDWQGEKYHGILRSDIGYWLDYAESEVIGNIFDDPELMEVEAHAAKGT